MTFEKEGEVEAAWEGYAGGKSDGDHAIQPHPREALTAAETGPPGPHERASRGGNDNRSSMQLSAILLILLAMIGGESAIRSGPGPRRPTVTRQQAEIFESRIRPILVENCLSCHGPKKQEAGLRLDSRRHSSEGPTPGR